jgi:cytochrome c oxidase cbb3-type subunit 3
MFWTFRKLVARVATCATVTMAQIWGQSPAASNDSALGQQTFSSCAACHGLDGRGGEHAPDIATDQNVQRLSDPALLNIVRNGIPAAGMPGFGKLLDDRQLRAVLKYVRVLQGRGETVKVVGNPNRGRELFFGSAGCAECHVVNGHGGFLAGDLSGYGHGHSAADIREAIVAPNNSLDARHGTVAVLTRSGTKYRGIVRNEDNFSLQMQTADGTFHLFDKSGLVRIEHESRSLMPSDYGSKLTRSDLDDLISFLSQAGGEKPERDKEQE